MAQEAGRWAFFEVHDGTSREGPGSDDSTGRAFEAVMKQWKVSSEDGDVRLLDVGCGPGKHTLLLGRLLSEATKGRECTLVGLDVHRPYLDALELIIDEQRGKDVKADVSRGVEMKTKLGSMFELSRIFDKEEDRFDIVWAESSVYVMGFDRALEEWKAVVKPNGFVVISELCWLVDEDKLATSVKEYWKKNYPGIRTVAANVDSIRRTQGYALIDHFVQPELDWWEYYRPQEAKIIEVRKKAQSLSDEEALKAVDAMQEEIEMYRVYQACYGYVFFILQRGLEATC